MAFYDITTKFCGWLQDGYRMATGWLQDGLWMISVVKSHRYAVFTTNYYKWCGFRVISTPKTRSIFFPSTFFFCSQANDLRNRKVGGEPLTYLVGNMDNCQAISTSVRRLVVGASGIVLRQCLPFENQSSRFRLRKLFGTNSPSGSVYRRR